MEIAKVGMIKQNWILKKPYENINKNEIMPTQEILRNKIYGSISNNLFKNVDEKVLLNLVIL